jgi:3-methyladenine DNA glycosylase AlkD
MVSSVLFKEIHDYCVKHQDPAIVKKYSRYFKEGYNAWGLKSGMVTEKSKDLVRTSGINLELVLETAPLLLKTGKYEETSFAIVLLIELQKHWTKETFRAFEKWFETGISNWGHTDFIGGEVMPLFFKKGLVTMKDLVRWKTAKNKFQRRAAVVSLIKQMKAASDFQPFFDFIDPMMMDPAREVHQGLGWFLREAWKKQPGPTETFLLKWKDFAPRLIFQYATEKMKPDQKEKFRRRRSQD